MGLTVQNVRTSLNKLKSTGELTHKPHSKYGIITINNYDKYQDTNSQPNTQLTVKQQSSNNKQQRNKETIKQDIKEYGTHIRMTETEYGKLLERFGQVLTDKYVEKVDLYMGSTGKKYKSHYMTVISWLNRDLEKDPKIKYAWQEELKAEQEVADAKVYEAKRDKKEVEDIFSKL